jgi:hypothetical protein
VNWLQKSASGVGSPSRSRSRLRAGRGPSPERSFRHGRMGVDRWTALYPSAGSAWLARALADGRRPGSGKPSLSAERRWNRSTVVSTAGVLARARKASRVGDGTSEVGPCARPNRRRMPFGATGSADRSGSSVVERRTLRCPAACCEVHRQPLGARVLVFEMWVAEVDRTRLRPSRLVVERLGPDGLALAEPRCH